MSTEYNPTEKNPSPPAREFTEQEVARCFGPRSDSGAAHEAGKNPARYERMKKQAIKDKLIPDMTVSQPWTDKSYRDRFKEAPLTEEQIRIRALVSEAEVRALYVNPVAGAKVTVSTLAADTSPEGKEKFRRIQDAAQEYGYVTKRQTPREPEPKPIEREAVFTLSPEHAQRLGMKPGTQVNQETYLRIVTILHDVDEQLAKAAAQKAQDAANDESVKSFGHVRETPGQRANAIERRTAEAVAEGLARHDAAKNAA